MNFNKNSLSEESSPYLLQHAANPIWWQAWNQSTLSYAKEARKPLFLSVGYSTCHWCHVMERESFEDLEVADFLNAHFICIKVDREENPDVDHLYMSALQAISGHGGWPMSVFLTPDLLPFYAGTYFPKDRFLNLLKHIADLWVQDNQKILKAGSEIQDWFSRPERLQNRTVENSVSIEDTKQKFVRSWIADFDEENGGARGAPKFPPAYRLHSLLFVSGQDEELRESVLFTLKKMAQAGIYDQVGGGFHRYATDEKWMIPHFEKMLYDQAALATVYTEAYQQSKNSEFLWVARDICDYVMRDLQSPEGAFYSAEDADSEGEEGLFYIWKKAELSEIFKHEGISLEAFTETLPLDVHGEFEGQQILYFHSETKLGQWGQLKPVRELLLKLRGQRERPLRDNKYLMAWNGLMISAFVGLHCALQGKERSYLEAAEKAARVGLNYFSQNGNWMRSFCNGKAKGAASLQDIAFFVDALLELHQATGESDWAQRAREIHDYAEKVFSENTGAYYAFDNRENPLWLRDIVIFDNVEPSGQSVTYRNLRRLHTIFGEENYFRRADALAQFLDSKISGYEQEVPVYLLERWKAEESWREIQYLGEDPRSFADLMISEFGHLKRWNTILKFMPSGEKKHFAVVCKNQTCGEPHENWESLKSELSRIQAEGGML